LCPSINKKMRTSGFQIRTDTSCIAIRNRMTGQWQLNKLTAYPFLQSWAHLTTFLPYAILTPDLQKWMKIPLYPESNPIRHSMGFVCWRAISNRDTDVILMAQGKTI
jgi:hypothetical protein